MKQYFIRQIQYNVFILILPLCSLKKAHHRPKFPPIKKTNKFQNKKTFPLFQKIHSQASKFTHSKPKSLSL